MSLPPSSHCPHLESGHSGLSPCRGGDEVPSMRKCFGNCKGLGPALPSPTLGQALNLSTAVGPRLAALPTGGGRPHLPRRTQHRQRDGRGQLPAGAPHAHLWHSSAQRQGDHPRGPRSTRGLGQRLSPFTDGPPVSPQALGSILAYLTDAKRKLRQVVWVNLREEAVLECDGHTHSLRWPGPPMASDQLEVRSSCLPHTPTLGAFWEIGLGGSSEDPVQALLVRWRNRGSKRSRLREWLSHISIWPSPWLWVPEAQEGAGVNMNARTGPGHGRLWPCGAGLEAASVA